MNTNPQKKQLKLSTPFDPNSSQQILGTQPLYPQQYQPPFSNQYTPVLPQQNMNMINQISLPINNSQPINQAIANKPEEQQQQTTLKPKKKLVLSNKTNFAPDAILQKQLEEKQQKQLEEEKIKKEQELIQQRLQELRKPLPYEKQKLISLVNCVSEFLDESLQNIGFNEQNKILEECGFLLPTLETLLPYFQKEEWQRLKERKHSNIKEIAVKNQARKDGKANTYSKPQQSSGGNQQRPSHKQNAPQPFEKGTNVQATQEQKEQPKLLIVRVQEDIATKQKKDEMKAQAEEFFQVLNRTPEYQEKVYRELRYRLNQLAPDNYDAISQKILEILVENTTDGDVGYLQYIAERIIEKSQTEPKYRKLYTKLCQMLVKEPKLEGMKEAKDGKEGRKTSLFKNQLLQLVSQIFYSKGKQEDIGHLKPEEKEQYHLIRKSKIMGTARFIGELFIMKLLPILAVEFAFQELIGGFILTFKADSDNSEEPIEGMVELIDQIGGTYSFKNQVELNSKHLEGFFDGKPKTKKEIETFFKVYEKNLSMDIIMAILDLLIKNYKLSQRISMLIENVQERRKQGWKDHYSRQEQAQSSNAIKIEQEKEQIEQSYTQSKVKNNRKNHEQQIVYVEKKDSSQPQQVKQQQFDLNDLSIFVQGTFSMDSGQQDIKLIEELKRISSCDEALLKFFEVFFEQMLSLKLMKKNIDRAQIVFELLQKPESKEDIVKKAIQKVLNEDKVYDLAESPIAINLFVDIITCCLNEADSDPTSLKKLYLKPQADIEDFTYFMGDVAGKLIAKFPEKGNLIGEYFNNLGYQLDA